MAKKCRHTGCEAFSRKLWSAEILNLEKFNLSKDQSREILHGTIRGLCPQHAALELHDDFSVPKYALGAIERNWDHHLTDNFTDAYAYAQCSCCNRLLSEDRGENTPDEVRDILMAYEVTPQRVETVVFLQSEATGGMGKCFSCCLKDPELLSAEACDADDIPELRESRAKKEEAQSRATRVSEGENERDHEQRKILMSEQNELLAEIQQKEQKIADLKAEIQEKQHLADIGRKALPAVRDRAVGAYKVLCESENKSPQESKIRKYEESTDVRYLQKEANGWWELIHSAEAKESDAKSLGARIGQTATPSKTEISFVA